MAYSSHAKRWMTVAVIVPILVVFFLKAPAWAFAIFAGLISAFALYEYFKNFCKTNPPLDWGYVVAVISSSLIIWAAAKGSIEYLYQVIWLTFFIYACRAMIRFNQGKVGYDLLAKEALSILYIPCFLSSIVLARCNDNNTLGVTYLFFILFLAFISDTGAYYAGKTFGKHKLIPNLSPNKTVEGAIGSIVADVIVVTIFKLTLLPQIPWFVVPILAASAAIATQLGDLFESMLKRSLDVKDSGTIFPGHGGMLDRIDGLLFTGPVVYLFMVTF